MKFFAALILVFAAAALAALEITGVKLRNDIYPLEIDEFQWVEGWGEQNQFFPRYFKPAATLQIAFRNDTGEAIGVADLTFAGRPIDAVTTHPEYAGPVIWHRSIPETVPPGGTAQLAIRLREAVAAPFEVGFNGTSVTVAPAMAEAIRILYVGFNAERDRLTVFVDALGGAGKLTGFTVDGREVAAAIRNSEFAGGNPALATIELAAPLAYGGWFILEARAEKAATFEQVRVRDDFFPVGIIGGNPDDHRRAGFNFLYNLHGGAAVPELPGFARLSPADNPEALEALAATRPGPAYFLGNVDEPDAREPAGLPYMERSGINAMRQVEPLMALQRRHDPAHLTALMIDRTYAPLNWYIYGQLPDLPFNDCYVPTIFHGYDSETVARTASTLLAAVAPRPPQMMLWTALNTAHSPRVTTPLENELQVHYTLGSGLKGLHYFIDWTSYPNLSEGGYYIGVSRVGPLWRSVARGNALADRLKALLNVAYPWRAASCDRPDEVWCQTLLAGEDSLIVTIVNRRVRVNALDRMKFVHSTPVRAAKVTVTLPEWFDAAVVCRVDWDRVTPVAAERDGRTLTLAVDELEAGRVLVISRDPAIAGRLAGDVALQSGVAALQRVDAIPAGEIVAARPRDLSRTIVLDAETVLDFTDPATLELAAEIRLDNAVLERCDGGVALRPGGEAREARAEILFAVEAPAGCAAELRGRTFSLGYLASLQLGAAAVTAGNFTNDTSLKPLWYRGEGSQEFLAADTAAGEDGRCYLRVTLKDPLIVAPDGYSVAARSLTLTPQI